MNTKENTIDLGSDNVNEEFDPFAADDNFEAIDTSADASETADNPPEKETPADEQNYADKLPIFDFAGATENIDDTAKTFEELRIEKATDFPELEDGKKVSWTIEYGKITKTVPNPKDTSIGKMKADIETSKEFLDSLKKRGAVKNPDCKIKPRVTAQNKGRQVSYKGVFSNMEEANAAGKIISILPARDGKVYEIRNTAMGKFITETANCDMLSEIRAGFTPALPMIPMDMMMRIVAFFRYYMHNGSEKEVLLNVYYDKQINEFFIEAPEQTVTKASVESRISEEFTNDRYIHYMDIHSHNSMKAFFSAIDNKDEKATRLYTVIGDLHEYFPDVKTRMSNGGKFHEINPAEIFELVARPFPDEWKDNVHFSDSHKDSVSDFNDVFGKFRDEADYI